LARVGFAISKSCAGLSRWRATASFIWSGGDQLENKSQLAHYIQERLGIEVDPASMFDVLVKRLHEYKRQHLQVLHIISLLKRIHRNPDAEVVPRTFVFGGKAAPGYRMAKLIIKLIHSVARWSTTTRW